MSTPDLDPRWEWTEIHRFGYPGPLYLKTRCLHTEPAPNPPTGWLCLTCGMTLPCPHTHALDVHSITGELVARLCPTCDTQLPTRAGKPCSACGRSRSECKTEDDPFLSCCPACAANDGDTHHPGRPTTTPATSPAANTPPRQHIANQTPSR